VSRVVGVDIGGTFTDLMLFDQTAGAVHVHKVPSTPAAPEQAMVEGLVELCRMAGIGPGEVTGVFHGTTVATNAVLEFEGAEVGLITTRGFRDVVHIGRHQRPQHYSVVQDIPWQARPFARRRHRHVVSERIAPPTGEVVVPLDEDEVRAAAEALKADGIEAVAVCFLFSYLNPAHEERAARIVREVMPEAFVTTSAGIVPQFREFERFTTALMSAFVGPGTGRYLERLDAALKGAGVEGELHVMMSSGGVASVRAAAERPEMVDVLGIDARRVHLVVFAVGTALALTAGVLAAPLYSVYPNMGDGFLIISFVVVVIGGLGSVSGAFWSALLIGLVDTLGKAYVPQGSGLAIYILMAVVLLWKPTGLFGRGA